MFDFDDPDDVDFLDDWGTICEHLKEKKIRGLNEKQGRKFW